EYKTLRYPGHFEKVKFLKDLGFFEEKPMRADGFKISPRKLFMELVGPRLAFPEDKDLVALRVCVRGTKNGQPMELVYDVLDFHDDRTGFSAMERTTGFSAAVVFRMLVQDRIKAVGALPVETAVPARPFIDEIRRRGIKIQETIRNLASV
ncbi:MAG: hypothetical protein HY400_07405, partial [Elusimicrobia bacterium]|nr:hypothetical protein [Elusimicrobiota bacterium]